MKDRKYSVQGKKVLVLLISMFFMLGTFAGCGEEEQSGSLPGFTLESGFGSTGGGANTGTSGSFEGSGTDATAHEQQAIKDAFYADNGQGSTPVWAGVQVYNGDVVNIWRKMNGSEDMQKAQDIYLYDSNDKGKVIAKGVPSACVGSWFYTDEGYCLNVMGSKLLCFTEEGTEKFDISVEGGVDGIVQLAEGTIVLLMKGADNTYSLAILDLEKASYEKVPNLNLGKDRRLFISAGDNSVVLLNQTGFFDVNLETGELTQRIALTEYNYEPDYKLKTFRMLDGACVELFYQEETKVLLPVDIEKYRTVVTLQVDKGVLDSAIFQLTEEFNATNQKYYVKIESVGDYASIEEVFEGWSEGTGGDLIQTQSIWWNQYVDKAIQQGHMEDMSPYMSASGIYEEDYFPTVFEKFKVDGGIYGVCYRTGASGFTYKEEVLGGRYIRNLEDFLDAMLAYVGPAVFGEPADSALWHFIQASDSVAGTVDWESKTCDFQGDLFAKLLEVCKLYGNDNYQNNDKYEIINSFITTSHFYGYLNEEQRELAGDVYLGYFFDEGCFPRADVYQTLHINRYSENKEGAWAFLSWVLGEEAQTQKNFTANSISRFLPANVYAFEAVVLLEQEETSLVQVSQNGTKAKFYKYLATSGIDTLEARKMADEEYRRLFDLKEQDVEEIRDQLYIAKPLPTRTEPIQDIIIEEAASYFNDERSLGDTCDAIQVKVQTYLDGLR